MSTLTLGAIDTLSALQAQIGAGNEKQGFHDQGKRLLTFVDQPEPGNDPLHDQDVANLRHYIMAKLGLIVTEAAEGIEEVRKGRAATETYYTRPDDEKVVITLGDDGVWRNLQGVAQADVALGKPQGLRSELADIVIRAFDLAAELKLPLAEDIDEKLTYNATRSRLHGKKL